MKKKPGVLYLSYDGLTDTLGQSQILPYLLGLSNEYDLTVVSFEKPDNFKSLSASVSEIIKGRINWKPLRYTRWPPVISTLLDLRTLNRTCRELISNSSFQLIHCRSYVTSIVGISLAKHYGQKFLFDMRGFWIQERIEGRIWNPVNPIFALVIRYFKKKEQEFIQHAHHIVVLTKKAEAIIKEIYPNSANKVSVIPCCVDMELFNYTIVSELDVNALRQKFNLKKENYTVLYLGSVGTWYLLDEMMRFYKLVRSIKQNARFLIITLDSDEIIIESARRHNIPDNEVIVAKANRNEVPDFLSMAKITLLFIRPSYSKKASSPTKFAEALAMGLPVVANAGIGDMDEYFDSNEIGLLVNSFDEHEFQRVLKEIDKLEKIDKESIRAVAGEHFSLEGGIAGYRMIYRNLLQ